MRPVRRPEHALGRPLYQRLRQPADIFVLRRPGLRGLVRRRELDPATPRIDQVEKALELLGIGRYGFQELSRMVDHELSWKALDLALVLRQLAAVELDVGVPTERMHPRHEPVHGIEPERAAVQRHDADRADAGPREPVELLVARAVL